MAFLIALKTFMKNLVHHTIVITCKDEKLIKSIRKYILELIKVNTSIKNSILVVSEPLKSISNDFFTLFIAPDGSKEGYDISFEFDNARSEIVRYLNQIDTKEKEAALFACVELKYGDGIIPEIVNYG
ncbi:MAG: hypothetical protein SNJ77_02585 [Cytophagales bacterium]